MNNEWKRGLDNTLTNVEAVMHDRHRKYGPGNIQRHGLKGVLVRLDDKIERLSNSDDDFSDESLRDCWMDVVGYGLIALMWLDGTWPGSPDTIKPEEPFVSDGCRPHICGPAC